MLLILQKYTHSRIVNRIEILRRKFVVRVSIIGSGPAGFYCAKYLIDNMDHNIHIDMFDRLPTPYGNSYAMIFLEDSIIFYVRIS